MDDDAKALRRTFKKPTLEQIKKAAARVIKGSRDEYGRSRVKQKGYQKDLANLRGLKFKTELAEQLEKNDKNITNETNTMTQAKTPSVEVLDKFPATEPSDLLKQIEQAKSNAKKAKEEIDRGLQTQIEKLAIPLKQKLAEMLFEVCGIIRQLDSEVICEDNYLKEEEYKDSVAFLKKRFKKKNESDDSDSGNKNKNAGKPKPGKKINAAIKRAGKAMTPGEIAKETGVEIEFVKTYLTSGESSIRYEKVGDGYNIKKQ